MQALFNYLWSADTSKVKEHEDPREELKQAIAKAPKIKP
jgi:hypothetical protein